MSTAISCQSTDMCSNQAIAKKATIKELAGDHNTAFNLYVTAVQNFLHLSKVLQDEKERVRCKQAASSALARAQKIKAFKNDALKPVARDFFSEGAYVSCPGDLGSTKYLLGQRKSESSWMQVPVIERKHITSGLNRPLKSSTIHKFSCTYAILV